MIHASDARQSQASLTPLIGANAMLDEAAALAFERPSGNEPYDETDISLRAYVTRIPERKLGEYEPSWSDKRLIEWDGNFRDDGDLMLVCCERDVAVEEYRGVLEEFLRHRHLVDD